MNKYNKLQKNNFIHHFSVKLNTQVRIEHVARIGVIRKAHSILVKKSEDRTT